jgi:hypothetical protein
MLEYEIKAIECVINLVRKSIEMRYSDSEERNLALYELQDLCEREGENTQAK